MERMIAQLLDITRIRVGGGIPLDLQPVDLADLGRRVIGELERAHPDCTIQLEVLGDVAGSWDRDRLAQLVSNLVGNACQHGLPDAPVQVRADGSQPHRVQLEVRNDGVIPPELLPGIFDAFHVRSSRRGSREGASGLGLGLYITQQIAVAHGGSIAAESDELQGTRFTVELPRHPPKDSEPVFGYAALPG
jgi:signal transduction histidine kinase